MKLKIGLVWLFCLGLITSVAQATTQEEQLELAETYSHQVIQHYYQGQFKQAQSLAEKTFEIRTAILGEKHSDTLNSLNDLAVIYQAFGHLDEARRLSEKSYRLRKEVLGEKHPDTLESLSNLAVIYQNLGHLKEALRLFDDCYRLTKEVLGEKHPDTLTSLNNLAGIYHDLGRLGEALPLFEEGYRLTTEVLGDKHKDTLTSLNNLAMIYKAVGSLDEALPLLENCYHLRKEVLREKHPETLLSLNNLASIYQDLGRLDEALPLFENSYHLHKEVLSEKHPETLLSLNNLATIYQDLGRLNDALPKFENCYQLTKEWLDDKHLLTLTCLNNLALIYRNLGHLKKALRLSEKGYRLTKEVLGDKHPLTLANLGNLVEIYKELGHLDEALPLYEKDYRLTREVLGDKHPDTLTSLNNLALAYAEKGAFDKAINHFEKLVDGVEVLRSGDLSAENRQALFKRYTPTYFYLSQLYLLRDNDAKAFKTAEMTKASTLLDSMALKSAVQQAGLTKEEQQQSQNHHRQITAFDKLIAHEGNLDKRLEYERQKNQVVKKAADYQRVLTGKYPKFKQLADPDIISTTKGAKLIPDNSLFISYMMKDNEVLVFTLDNRGDLQTHYLGEIAGLEQTLETYRELLGEPYTVIQLRYETGQYVWQLTDGSFVINRIQPKNTKRIGNIEVIRRYLSKKLLAPLNERLRNHSRWIISPDSALALIPFETLLLDKELVIKKHSVSYVQSLSVLAMLKQREQALKSVKNQKTLLAMGAARYQPPEKVICPEKCNKPKRDNPQKASDILWCNLPYAKKELEALKQLFPDSSIYQETEATEAKLRALNQAKVLTQYEYLVFSAHGFLSQTPALSAIVLDQLDTTADADGYVTASEWIGYTLQSDLMVLSGCDTGRGETMRGEGVMGLPYAFYVAGNKNTIMTLWKVIDKSTAEFIKGFFEKVKLGKSHLEALTETKREFLHSEQYKRPLFWAPFVLYGI